MATVDTRVNDLIINRMTQEQFDALQEKSPTELYIVEGGTSIYAEQFTEMPTASASYSGRIVQYVGSTANGYTHGYFYQCVNNSGTYSWAYINVQPDITVDSSLSDVSTNPVQNKVVKGALDLKADSANSSKIEYRVWGPNE